MRIRHGLLCIVLIAGCAAEIENPAPIINTHPKADSLIDGGDGDATGQGDLAWVPGPTFDLGGLDFEAPAVADLAPAAPPVDLAPPPPPSPPLCVPGISSHCFGPGELWTGTLCCVANVSLCVAGASSSCYGPGEHFTGLLCCVEGVSQCVAGTSTSCSGPGKHWTGSLCCL